jgi:hypothetical protein
VQRFVDDVVRCRKFETWGLGEEELREFVEEARPDTYASAVSAVYGCYGHRKGKSAERWGDKNNFYLDHISTLKAMFPTACFIHIVRDGRNVACSYRGLHEKRIESEYAPRLPKRIEEIAREWAQNVDTIIAGFESIGWQDVHEIRFEDLLLQPEKELRTICEFLGEGYDPSMMDYHRINREQQLEPVEFLQWKERTLEPLVVTQVDKFRKNLTTEQRTSFEEIAHRPLQRYRFLEGS